jgi:hypothetical protein
MRGALVALVGLLFSGLGCELRFPGQPDPAHANCVARRHAHLLDLETLYPDHPLDFALSYEASAGRDWPPSTARFHNLGNAYFLADRLPEAILAFRRGLRLDPNDGGLADNLDYARARVQNLFGNRGRPEEESWPPWLYQPSPFQVLVVALILYSAACVLATRWLMTRRRALMVRAILVFILAAAGGFFWLYLKNENTWQDQHPLVVIREDKLPLRKGNGPSYAANADLPVLSRGMEARRLHERGGWLQIQFPSGEVGWVEKTAVLVDEP